MTVKAETAGPLHAPMSEILARAGHELGRLSGRLGRVENLLGPLILEAARRDALLVSNIQDLDHIRQNVEALADFLVALALIAPDRLLVDASGPAELVKLADLAARLTLADHGAGDDGAEWGDFELF